MAFLRNNLFIQSSFLNIDWWSQSCSGNRFNFAAVFLHVCMRRLVLMYSIMFMDLYERMREIKYMLLMRRRSSSIFRKQKTNSFSLAEEQVCRKKLRLKYGVTQILRRNMGNISIRSTVPYHPCCCYRLS